MIYNVEFRLGQALVEARTEKIAKDYAKAEWGHFNGPYTVTRATEEDISWVNAMGGSITQGLTNN